MFKIDLSQKNASVSIIFTLDMIFFGIWLVLGWHPTTQSMADKVWGAFLGANGALFLVLNTEAKKDAGIPPDTLPPDPTTPETPAITTK